MEIIAFSILVYLMLGASVSYTALNSMHVPWLHTQNKLLVFIKITVASPVVWLYIIVKQIFRRR
jgi:hypothetical protein